MRKLNSLTIFFPFFNDEGTVEDAILKAFDIGRLATDDLEVIALHGGNSKDNTWQKILEMKKRHRALKVINKADNLIGYAVIKFGIFAATKEWVFYTDGDLQYDVKELITLVKAAHKSSADIINGYKVNRNDHLHRVLLGNIYKRVAQTLFRLPIKDVDCDFRLMKKSYLNRITLDATHAAILPELVFKLKLARAKFYEVPVSHFPRRYGTSNYKWWQLTWEKLSGDLQLYFKLQNFKQNQEKSHF